MKIEFPLYLVCDPQPGELAAQICTEAWPMDLVTMLRDGENWPNGALYTIKDEAEADAAARIAARDADAQQARWVRLCDVKPGRMFETQDGCCGMRLTGGAGPLCRVAWAGSGDVGNVHDLTPVREVP